jgi:hemerythrin
MFKAVIWRPELELGVDMMDRHHRGMVRLCGAILETAGTRTGTMAAGNLFLELVGLTAMHFEAEEELMRRSQFPGRMDHQDRHHELSLLLQSWEIRARRARPLNSSFLQHLNQWVENHILGSDKGFSRFLLGREGQDPTEPSAQKKEACLIRQTSVPFKPVSCDRFAQSQTIRRRFNRSLTRIEHF